MIEDVEEEQFDESDYDPKRLGNTVELSDKGFSQEIVQEMNLNRLKISKLKLKNLIKRKKQLKKYMKENLLTKRKAEALP